MRKLFIILFISSGLSAGAQMNFMLEDGVFTMQGVIETDKSKEQIYNRVLDWYASHFKSAKAVIDYENYETGKVQGNYYENYSLALSPVSWRHKIVVEFKDNKARVTINNIVNEAGVTMTEYLVNKKGEYRSMYSGLRNKVVTHGKGVYASLKEKLSEDETEDDW